MINCVEPGWLVQRVGGGVVQEYSLGKLVCPKELLVQRVVRVPHERLVKLEKPLVQGLCRGCAGIFVDRIFFIKSSR